MQNSLWNATYTVPPRVSQIEDEYDVVVVGGGVVGIMTAHFLSGKGRRVALFEGGKVLQGVTGHTTGKLTSQHGLIYSTLIKEFGVDKARAYAEANQWAIKFVADQGIDCDLVENRAHVFAMTESEAQEFDQELEACQKLGLPASIVDPSLAPVPVHRVLGFERQYRFHPVKFLAGILERIEAHGVAVAENVRVEKVEEDGVEVRLKVGERTIHAQQAVMATHYPIHDSDWFVAKLAPYRAYAASFRLAEPVPEGMFISVGEPSRSWRKHADEFGEVLIVGGGHHKVGQMENSEANWKEIEDWARLNFNVVSMTHRWSTQDNWTPDGLPFVGLSPHLKRTYLATGFGGWGMTNGIASGKLIADLIERAESPWADVFDPSRSELSRIGTIAKENLDTASHLVGDRLSPAECRSVEEVPSGQGKIVQLADRRVAAYRDMNGKLSMLVSACTHMGCQLAWNSAEKTWDCPCHGSRFDPSGKVLQGPATTPLKQVDSAAGDRN